MLPQTQCRRCGFEGCAPYADAIAAGTASINRCPPGGERGVARLAALLGVPQLPLDPERGAPGMGVLALIDESLCIGCTLCIQACPVDAIVGAAKRMHTVMLEECSGCGLCVPPCPVDCIDMVPIAALAPTHGVTARADDSLTENAARWRARYEARGARLAAPTPATRKRPAELAGAGAMSGADDQADARRQAAVAAALARARERRGAHAGGHE